jgi:hypothetical protein
MRDLVGGLLSWEANYLATNNKVGRVFVFHEGKTNKPPIDDFSWHDDKDVQRSLYQLKK